MRTSARSGQRSRARAASRQCSEFLVESGIFGIASSSPSIGVAPTEAMVAARQTAMATVSPYRVVLTDQERRVLVKRARSERAAHRDVLRAQIILAAAEDASNAETARSLGVCDDTVRTWRSRFCDQRLPGLADRPRPGRQRTFPKTAEAEVKALACELPAQTEVPLDRWSYTELAAEAVSRAVVESISASTVARWLRADAIRPWRVRSWIFPRDPDLVVKAGGALDLY